MSSIRHSNYLPTLRILVMLLVMAFVLASMAHAGHDHSKEQAQHQVCDYCAGFGHLGAASSKLVTALSIEFMDEAPVIKQWNAPTLHIQSTAQPRAPPAR
jgi:hypothetical protein